MSTVSRRWPVTALLVVLSLFLTACSGAKDAASQRTGGCAPSSSPFLQQDESVDGSISYCAGGDGWTGRIETAPYPAGTTTLQVLVVGYPETPGIKILAVSTDGKIVQQLAAKNSGESWKRTAFDVPAALRDRAFRLVLDDSAAVGFGWAGLGVSTRSLAQGFLKNGVPMLLVVLLAHLWLNLLALAMPRDLRLDARIVGALLGLGIAALATVAAYVASPIFGKTISILMLLGPVAMVLLRRKDRARLLLTFGQTNRLTAPSLVLTAFLLTVALFPFSWTGADWLEPGHRWLDDLPQDIWLPYVFADMLRKGHLVVPMIGDWLSSDRPPLQSGIYLLFDLGWRVKGGLIYQAVSTWAQTLVLVPVAMLLAHHVRPVTAGVIVFAVATSGLMYLHGIFVWPKLLAATFCALYHYQLFSKRDGRSTVRGISAGLAAAIAMLAHGGSLFALAGSTIAYVMRRQEPGWFRPLAAGAVSAALLYLPWVAYQRLIDPPGDRLLKWHFGGQIDITDRSLGDVLTSAYSNLTLQQWWSARTANWGIVFNDLRAFPSHVHALLFQHSTDTAHKLVENTFFFTGYSLWFASPLLAIPCAAIIFAKHRTGQRWPAFPPGIIGSVVAGLLFWIVVMFSPASTLIHHGAYFTMILFQLVMLLLIAHAWRPALYACVLLNTLVGFAAYVFDRPAGALPAFYAFAAAVLFLGILLFLASLSASKSLGAPALVAQDSG